MEVSLGGGPGQGSEEEAMAVREETGKHLGTDCNLGRWAFRWNLLLSNYIPRGGGLGMMRYLGFANCDEYGIPPALHPPQATNQPIFPALYLRPPWRFDLSRGKDRRRRRKRGMAALG